MAQSTIERLVGRHFSDSHDAGMHKLDSLYDDLEVSRRSLYADGRHDSFLELNIKFSPRDQEKLRETSDYDEALTALMAEPSSYSNLLSEHHDRLDVMAGPRLVSPHAFYEEVSAVETQLKKDCYVFGKPDAITSKIEWLLSKLFAYKQAFDDYQLIEKHSAEISGEARTVSVGLSEIPKTRTDVTYLN